MNLTRALVIIVGLVLLGAGAWFGRGLFLQERPRAVQVTAPRPEPPKVTAPQVLVARNDLQTGQIIKPDDLRWQVWPEGTLSPTYVVESRRPMSDFVGAVARQPISTGEPITEARIVLPGSRSFMSAVLRPGMRAVSVAVTPTSGIAGFVFAGDQVDLILTHKITRGEGRDHLVTETLLRNVRVLAMDQKVDAKPGDPAQIARTATFELTPKQVEIIAIATEMGRLSLSLRSLQDNPDTEREADSIRVGDEVEIEAGRDLRLAGFSYTRDDQVSRFVAPLTARGNVGGVAIFRGTVASAAPPIAQGGAK
jgi:pilus assembly protein CpaB